MKKILTSLAILAFFATIATPLTLARPHHNPATPAGAVGADGIIRNTDANNYQNLRGNYKTTPTPAGVVGADGAAVRGAVPENNLKPNFNRADGVAGAVAPATAPSRARRR